MSFSLSLSHPINTALLLYILYLLQRIILPSTSVPRIPPAEFKAGYSWRPRSHAPALLFTTFTPRTLTKFNGIDGGRILLAIAGTVFDVTAGRGFYGPGKIKKLYSFLLFAQKGRLKMGCTVTLRGEMRPAVWRNSLSISVRPIRFFVQKPSCLDSIIVEMLTPVDQPLDKLEDLTPEEMSVVTRFEFSRSTMADLVNPPFSART
jgi:membrane-associated progesterone receptor component